MTGEDSASVHKLLCMHMFVLFKPQCSVQLCTNCTSHSATTVETLQVQYKFTMYMYVNDGTCMYKETTKKLTDQEDS